MGKCGGMFFGLFLFVVGLSWFGNEAGWWQFELPWLPLAVMLIGASMVFKALNH